jgi:hypothetical protein
MPIISLLSQSSFDPDMTNTLTAAFDIAWERIKSSGSPIVADETASPARDALAKHIIAMAQSGERDRNRLVERAVAHIAAVSTARKPSSAAVSGSAGQKRSITDASE